MDIGQKIKTIRIKSGVKSASEFARISGVPQQTISDIENHKNSPNVVTLEKLCKPLGITLADFFSEEPNVLPQFERELIKYSKNLPEIQRDAILHLLKAISPSK